MPFIFEQMQYLYFLQEFRTPAIDWIFRFLNVFDTDYFISSLIAFIWIGFSWRWGVRLGFLMIVSGWVNSIAKLAFAWPRPFFLDPSLAIVKVHDYGFPSCGAQNSLLFACILIYFWKSRWAWPVGLLYLVIISFSRMFLGVHFPVDVLGGWAVGAFLFILFIKSYRLIERLAARHPLGALTFAAATALILGCVFRDHDTTFLMASLAAMVIGVYFSTRFNLYLDPPQDLRKKIFLGLFGVCSAALLTIFARIFIHDPFFSLIVQAMISGLWISLLASPFCKMVFLKRPERGNL